MAEKALASHAIDHSSNAEKFKEDLMNIARTTLSSKILTQHKEKFAKLAVDAVLRLKVLVSLKFYPARFVFAVFYDGVSMQLKVLFQINIPCTSSLNVSYRGAVT